MAEAGGGPSSGGGATLKDQGNEFFKAGNYLKAAALYTQAIKLEPSNPTLYRFDIESFVVWVFVDVLFFLMMYDEKEEILEEFNFLDSGCDTFSKDGSFCVNIVLFL